jgi:hypothetical protein
MRQLEDPRVSEGPPADRGGPLPGGRRRRRVAPVVPILLVLALLVGGAGGVVLALQRDHGDEPTAPPFRDEGTPCRKEPLAHVHDPSRLELVAACATASGVVRQADRREGDGNWVLSVAVDDADRRYLPRSNHGRLLVEIIPTDDVAVPDVGTRASFTGAWVLDRNKERRAAIHPAWGVAVDGRPLVPAPGPALAVEASVPPAVPVGADVAVRIRATQARQGTTAPASQVNLFLELVDDEGRAVRWKADATTTLGAAEVRLVSLQVPGRYILTVYAEKGGARQTTAVPVTVRRR